MSLLLWFSVIYLVSCLWMFFFVEILRRVDKRHGYVYSSGEYIQMFLLTFFPILNTILIPFSISFLCEERDELFK
jgi:hypothetical protein